MFLSSSIQIYGMRMRVCDRDRVTKELSVLVTNLHQLWLFAESNSPGEKLIDSFARQLFIWKKPIPAYRGNTVRHMPYLS